MSHTIEKDWTTHAGLRAICLICVREDGTKSHRCGYVGVPKDHPLYKVKYGDRVKKLKAYTSPNTDATVPSEATPECVFEVHGGITYTGNYKLDMPERATESDYPAKGNEWWLGFDCHHAYDREIEPWTDPHVAEFMLSFQNGEARSQQYVEAECERLAAQIVDAFRPVPNSTRELKEERARNR